LVDRVKPERYKKRNPTQKNDKSMVEVNDGLRQALDLNPKTGHPDDRWEQRKVLRATKYKLTRAMSYKFGEDK
jgi:hypothetical protein